MQPKKANEFTFCGKSRTIRVLDDKIMPKHGKSSAKKSAPKIKSTTHEKGKHYNVRVKLQSAKKQAQDACFKAAADKNSIHKKSDGQTTSKISVTRLAPKPRVMVDGIKKINTIHHNTSNIDRNLQPGSE